jgi:hypothetical protein
MDESRKFRESKMQRAFSTHKFSTLSFFQALFNFVHCFVFKSTKSMSKSINHNRWIILKRFNFKVDKTSPITIVCCKLQNYCEMWGALKLRLANARIRGDNLMGFGVDKLPIIREGE